MPGAARLESAECTILLGPPFPEQCWPQDTHSDLQWDAAELPGLRDLEQVPPPLRASVSSSEERNHFKSFLKLNMF